MQIEGHRTKCTLCAIKFHGLTAEQRENKTYHSLVHRTNKMCKYCNVYLCANCFGPFHAK